jgi:hypothetical protein
VRSVHLSMFELAINYCMQIICPYQLVVLAPGYSELVVLLPVERGGKFPPWHPAALMSLSQHADASSFVPNRPRACGSVQCNITIILVTPRAPSMHYLYGHLVSHITQASRITAVSRPYTRNSPVGCQVAMFTQHPHHL